MLNAIYKSIYRSKNIEFLRQPKSSRNSELTQRLFAITHFSTDIAATMPKTSLDKSKLRRHGNSGLPSKKSGKHRHGAAAVLFSLCLPSTGQAAENTAITLYGVIDVALGYARHGLSADPYFTSGLDGIPVPKSNHPVVAMIPSAIEGSRWGIKGTEKISDESSAYFILESAFNPPSGVLTNSPQSTLNAGSATNPANSYGDSSLAGQLFGREAVLGLRHKHWGDLSIGRNKSFGIDAISKTDPMGGSQAYSPLGFNGAYAGGGDTADARQDNSMKYTVRLTPEFSAGMLYAFGEKAGSMKNSSAQQLMLSYETPRFTAIGTYQRKYDSASVSGKTAGQSIALSFYDTESYLLGISYKFDTWTAKAGYERISFATPDNSATYYRTTYTSYFGLPVGAWNSGGTNAGKKLDVFWAGASLPLSDALDFGLAYYRIQQNDYSASTCQVNSYKCSGSQNFLSSRLEYNFSKATNLYFGLLYTKLLGGAAYGPSSPYLYDNNLYVTTGIRHRF